MLSGQTEIQVAQVVPRRRTNNEAELNEAPDALTEANLVELE